MNTPSMTWFAFLKIFLLVRLGLEGKKSGFGGYKTVKWRLHVRPLTIAHSTAHLLKVSLGLKAAIFENWCFF